MDILLLLIRIVSVLVLTVLSAAMFDRLGKVTRPQVWTHRKALFGVSIFWSVYLLGFLSHG